MNYQRPTNANCRAGFLHAACSVTYFCVLIICLAIGSAGCGTWIGNPSKKTGTEGNTSTPTVAADSGSQRAAVQDNTDAVISTISNGGSSGLSLVADSFGATRTCVLNSTATPNTLTVTRVESGANGGQTFVNNADGSTSGDVETWTPGASFGHTSGNIGYTSTTGTVGAPNRAPPLMACDTTNGGAKIGWDFSQNVAGMTVTVTTAETFTRVNEKGDNTTKAEKGTRTIVYVDPAKVPPFANASGTPAVPAIGYFDAKAGTLTLTRTITIGSAANPNTTTRSTTTIGGVVQTLHSSVYSDPANPVVDFTVSTIGGMWVTKTLNAGAIIINKAEDGSTVQSAFTVPVKFQYSDDHEKACIPVSGVIKSTITPTSATLSAIYITLRFGTSISSAVTSTSGVTSEVTCAKPDATNCTAQLETDDADFKPTGCNF